MIPTLYTPRLVLRLFTLADAARVQYLASDKRVAEMTANVPHPFPDGAAEKWISAYERAADEGRQFNFAVTLAGTKTPGRENDFTDTGHLIGAFNLSSRGTASDNDAGLGFWIGIPYWNKGFATEAANAVLNFAFTRCRYDRVIAGHIVQNPASGRVLQKLGMAPGEPEHRDFPVRGGSFEVIPYTLTRNSWSRRQIIHRWKPAHPCALATT